MRLKKIKESIDKIMPELEKIADHLMKVGVSKYSGSLTLWPMGLRVTFGEDKCFKNRKEIEIVDEGGDSE